MDSEVPLRVGMVGAGRSRNGLGPFLARFLHRAGAPVVCVSGRGQQSAVLAAAALEAEFGGAVVPCGGVEELVGLELDAMVVASPVAAHREALVAAGAVGRATLCEKPLVEPADLAGVPALLEPFRRGGVALWENCQWPLVLPAWRRLFPEAPPLPAVSVAMGLGPTGRGRAMVDDALPHLVSVLQAVLDVGPATTVRGVRLVGGDERLELAFELAGPFPPVRASLELVHTPEQPRSAWLALDGRRADRRVELPSYRLFLRGDGRKVSVHDPLEALVYGFVAAVRRQDPEANRREITRIHERARIQSIVHAAL